MKREIQSRFRGSLFGLLWTILVPIVMLMIYSFVFGVIFEPRWDLPPGGRGTFSLLLFSGLVLFSLFAESVSRAPDLVLENVSYVKRVVFPLEVLPWVALGSACFTAASASVALFVYYGIAVGMPPLTVLWLPLCLLPLLLLTVGTTWLLSGLGVYLRDLRQVVGVLTASLYFLSPVFYPLTAIPAEYRRYLEFNPLAVVLESTKAALFYGVRPSLGALTVASVFAAAVAWTGHAAFRRLRPGFADVV